MKQADQYTIGKETHTLSEWSVITRIKSNTLRSRIDSGKHAAEVLAPVRKYRKYEYKGKPITCQQLATLAGCSKKTMWRRLAKCTPEEAVDKGRAARGGFRCRK